MKDGLLEEWDTLAFQNYVLQLYVGTTEMMFKVHLVVGEEGSHGKKENLFQMKDGGFTTHITEADALLAGRIRWDGCSNWGPMHLCGYQDAEGIGDVIKEIYRIAAQRIPLFDCALAKISPLSEEEIS